MAKEMSLKELEKERKKALKEKGKYEKKYIALTRLLEEKRKKGGEK